MQVCVVYVLVCVGTQCEVREILAISVQQMDAFGDSGRMMQGIK
jgi:hypothetical protein